MVDTLKDYFDREQYLSTLFSDYIDRFGDTLPDAHQLKPRQLKNLSAYVEDALRRGSALTAKDFGLEQWAEVDHAEEVI